MSIGAPAVFGNRRPALALLVSLAAIGWSTSVVAQDDGGTTTAVVATRAVGGVTVDPSGMLDNADVAIRGEIARQIAAKLAAVPEGLDRATDVRKISLKRLDAAIGQALAGGQIPDAIQCLGGLQKIDYVVVSRENQDIYLVGPAEAWKADEKGAVVGVKSGRPVMLLDDLVVALRAAAAPNKSVISCSIDPTQEGLQRLRVQAASLRPGTNPRAAATRIEDVLGPQTISVTGVPETSHFARVLVAADYRMKRISMGLEPSPVKGLPSFLEMAKFGSQGMQDMLPRWWLEPDYAPLLRDQEGLTWQLRKASVKTLTENDYLDASGVKRNTGKSDAVSQRWANLMTEHYDALAAADPVFGELRNCMDLAVVSALVVGFDLTEKAGIRLPHLIGSEGVKTASLNAPKQVASKASLVRFSRGWKIACGGVSINPWQYISESQPEASLSAVGEKFSMPEDAQWWAN